MTTSASTPRLRILFASYVALLVIVAISDRSRLGATTGEVMRLTGLVTMLLAALGRIWASAHIAGCKDARLVTSGPYSACRNPLYAFSILGGVGVGLATRSVALTLVTVVLVLVLHLRAILAEERFLRRAHGESFERYCERVPRLLPSWKNYEAAESVVIVPAVFRKAFLDAASFMLIFVIIALLDLLREMGTLPTWLRL